MCDAGPVIHLDEVGCLDILQDFPRLILPAKVRREVERHRPAAVGVLAHSWHHAVPSGPIPPDLFVLARLLPLHDGEVDALRIAIEHPGSLFLTDDAAARLAARSFKISMHGTIGLLVRSVRRRQRSRNAVVSLLRGMPRESTLYVKPELLDEVIQHLEGSGGG